MFRELVLDKNRLQGNEAVIFSSKMDRQEKTLSIKKPNADESEFGFK